MSMQQFCLRWNNHQPNFISVFSNLLHNETLVDVTLAAEGHHLQAHKVVLSACSSYFQSLFTVNPCQHPIVILKDIKFADLKIMVDFMYYGEVNVSQEQLPSIIKTAESLKIKGLAEMHSGSFSKWPCESRERGESCSPSSSPQTPSYRRKRMRKSSTGSNSGSGDKGDDISEITLVATNTIKPEPAIASQDAGDNSRRPVNTNTESQGSIEEDQISIMSNMESNSTATPVQSETPIQDLNQQPNSNMSQSSTVSQAQAHQESRIDKGFFDFMTDGMIKDMIPEIDVRYRFKLKYDEYKSKLAQQIQKPAQESPSLDSDPLKSGEQMDELMDIEEALFLDAEKHSEDPRHNEMTNVSEKQNSYAPVYSTYDSSSMQSCSNYSDEVGSHSREPNISLRQLLIEDSTGREILKMYEKIGKVDRSKLATVIIRKETEHDPDTRIRGDRFSYWAQEIVTLFPNELKETYYIPYTRGPDGPLSARGILYTKYTNRRRSLRGKGILEPTKVRYKKNSLEFPAGAYEDDAEGECLEWLMQNVEPATEVIEKWTASSRLRFSKLDNTTIEEHFDKFKCLQQDYGHILIDIDFRFLHGNACDKLPRVWPDIASRIIAYSKKQTNVEIKNFLMLYNAEIEEGNITIVALMLLPLLLKTVTMKSSFGDHTFRPTREHVQKNFIIHVSDISYIQAAMQDRKKFLNDYKLSEYPVPVFVGSMQEIKSSFVFVNDVQYRLESPLKAVETCFKIFFAVNTDYPKLCEHVWAFFEKYVFQIRRQHAPHYVSANSLASDLGLS